MGKERFEDGYCKVFNDFELLKTEIAENERSTRWITDVISKDIKISSFEPVESSVVSGKIGVPYDVVLDTGENTKLLLEYAGKTYCLRDTAINTILETAKINGSSLGRLSPFVLSEVLNRCLTVAKGDSLLLERGGKICACLSDVYKIMPIQQLIDITTETLTGKFGEIKFTEGEYNYEYVSAFWELPEAQEILLDKYNNAVKSHPTRLHGRTFMPAVRFITSDIGKYAATLIPVFKMSNNSYFRINGGIKVAHKGGGNIIGLDAYKDEADKIFAKFCDVEKTLAAMAECEIHNPLNALVGMCKKAGIGKTYATEAYEEIERFTCGRSCFMDDIYLSIAGCTAEAKSKGVTGTKLLGLEEAVAKILYYKWEEFDVPGVVSWN